MQRSSDPDIGLQMATFVDQNISTFVIHSAHCTPTMGEGLKRLVQYSQVANTGRKVTLEIQTEVARASPT